VPAEFDQLAAIVHRAQAYTNSSGAAIALGSVSKGELICRARSGSRAPDIGTTLLLEGTFTGLCVQSGKLMRCNDTEMEARVDTAAARALGIRSMMVAPIACPSGVSGALALFSFTPNAFTGMHEAVVKTLADEAAGFLQKQSIAPPGEMTTEERDLLAGKAGVTRAAQSLPQPDGPREREKTSTAVSGLTSATPAARVEPASNRLAMKAPSKSARGRIFPLAVGLGIVLIVAGALWEFLKPERPNLALAGSFPPTFRIHGSNTLGSDCIPALIKAYLSHLGASDIQVTQSRKEEIFISGKTAKGSSVGVEIQSHGSWTGFKDLADGKAELAMASTRLPASESVKGDSTDAQAKRAALEKIKGLKTAATEYVVGLDGIAIIGSQIRASLSLSKQQVCDMFSGKITNWSQVDPAHPGVVKTYVRDKNSGTRKTFVDLCYDGQDKLPSAGMDVFEDSHQLSTTVSKDADAIGFIGLPFVSPASAIAVDGKLPAESSVRLEEYALTRRLYLYRNVYDPAESGYIKDFIEFALSSEGQNIVRQAGFVDQVIKLESPEPVRGAPRDYLALTAGARRASLEVRFESSSAVMDSKAVRDVARLKKFFEDSHAAAQNILVLGFADRTGTPSRNCAVSAERARLVEDQLHRIGLANTTASAFGQAMPLTEEAGLEGMAKNRRVEIWVAENLHEYTGAKTCP
jgi:phosphate transport system substrate-binding protein